jgi:beta-lactam-binding protein with PASTA domain
MQFSDKEMYEVVAQHPKHGTTGPTGTKVELTISKGPRPGSHKPKGSHRPGKGRR